MGMYIDIDYLRVFVGERELANASDIDYGLTENEDKINQCINFAESYVNSCLGVKYKIPLTCAYDHSSSMIKQIVADLSRFQYEQNRTSIEVGERHEAAVNLIESIVTGVKSIRCDEGHLLLSENADNLVFVSATPDAPRSSCLSCTCSRVCGICRCINHGCC